MFIMTDNDFLLFFLSQVLSFLFAYGIVKRRGGESLNADEDSEDHDVVSKTLNIFASFYIITMSS